MTGFHFRCPHCGSVEWYGATVAQLNEAADKPHAIITARCKCCSHIWARYAEVVFGAEEEYETIELYGGTK